MSGACGPAAGSEGNSGNPLLLCAALWVCGSVRLTAREVNARSVLRSVHGTPDVPARAKGRCPRVHARYRLSPYVLLHHTE